MTFRLHRPTAVTITITITTTITITITVAVIVVSPSRRVRLNSSSEAKCSLSNHPRYKVVICMPLKMSGEKLNTMQVWTGWARVG